MSDLRDFFKLLRYLLIFLVVFMGMAFYSKARASSCSDPMYAWNVYSLLSVSCPTSEPIYQSCRQLVLYDGCLGNNQPPTRDGTDFAKSYLKVDPELTVLKTFWKPYSSTYHFYAIETTYKNSDVMPKPPCETPKTDSQCNKGNVSLVTGNQAFWDSGNYKGCTFVSSGVGVTDKNGNKTQDAKSTGSTGQAWCSESDSTYNPVDDAALAANPDLKPALDNKPSNCPNGWVQAGGSKYYCVENGSVDAPPDKVNPDGSINSDKDGNPQPPDANVGKPPKDDGGDGGSGGDGSGGDGSGGDGSGGVSKADITEAVQKGVEDALGKKSGSPAPFVPPTVEGVEGGVNGVMSRYKQRINNAPISTAFNNISFSVPSAGCSPWGIHLDYLDVDLQFDQCAFLNSHSGMIGALMMAVFAGLSLVVFLKA